MAANDSANDTPGTRLGLVHLGSNTHGSEAAVPAGHTWQVVGDVVIGNDAMLRIEDGATLQVHGQAEPLAYRNLLTPSLAEMAAYKNPFADMLAEMAAYKNPFADMLAEMAAYKNPFADILAEMEEKQPASELRTTQLGVLAEWAPKSEILARQAIATHRPGHRQPEPPAAVQVVSITADNWRDVVSQVVSQVLTTGLAKPDELFSLALTTGQANAIQVYECLQQHVGKSKRGPQEAPLAIKIQLNDLYEIEKRKRGRYYSQEQFMHGAGGEIWRVSAKQFERYRREVKLLRAIGMIPKYEDS